MFTLTQYHIGISKALAASGENLIIEAGPGSGKTTTGVELVMPALVDSRGAGVAVAFNNKNARELEARVAGKRGISASTMHTFCRGIYEARNGRVKVDGDQKAGFDRYTRRPTPPRDGKFAQVAARTYEGEPMPFQQILLPARKVGKFVELVMDEAMGLPGELPVDEETVADLYEKKTGQKPDEKFPAWVVRAYHASLNDRKRMDYSEMKYWQALDSTPLPAIKWLFFDEAQDATPLDLYILKRLSAAGIRIVAVGDPRQGINGFAGAMPDAIVRIQAGLNARILPLTESFRCSLAAIREAHRYFPGAIEAGPNAKEGSVENISIADLPLDSMAKESACLARTHKLLLPIASALMREARAFTYKGAGDIAGALNRIIYKARIRGMEVEEAQVAVHRMQQKAEEKHRKNYPDKNQPQWLTEQGENVLAVCDLLTVMGERNPQNPVAALEAYLERLADYEAGSDGPTLATFHASKGMEWPAVYIVGPLESPRAVTEQEVKAEKCVAFVALTRSSDRIIYVAEDKKK